jgi:hypothetical protein
MQNLLANQENEQKETGCSGAPIHRDGQDRRGTSLGDDWDRSARDDDPEMNA